MYDLAVQKVNKKSRIKRLGRVIDNKLRTRHAIQMCKEHLIFFIFEKMLMKIGKATGGTMFTNIKLLLLLINPEKLYTFKELLESAIKLGVEYMKIKDFDVDQYITDGEKVLKQCERL